MVTELRVFTHPACAGCGTAVALAWELAESRPDRLSLRTVSLEREAGLNEAHASDVRTIPTIVIAVDGQERQRIVGTPKARELREAVERILDAGA
jgi:thioredoxin-like negative regulator of GroEL